MHKITVPHFENTRRTQGQRLDVLPALSVLGTLLLTAVPSWSFAEEVTQETTIDTRGTVVDTLIEVETTEGTDLTILTGDVNSDLEYLATVSAINGGSGALTIDTTAGTISASGDVYATGISATNKGTDLIVTTADVFANVRGGSGADSPIGLLLTNDGSGDLIIDTSAGSVEDIHATNRGDAFSITTGNVFSGINASNKGTGAFEIDTTAGYVKEAFEYGNISSSAITVSSLNGLNIETADVDSINATNATTGSLTIDTTAGTVLGGGEYITEGGYITKVDPSEGNDGYAEVYASSITATSGAGSLQITVADVQSHAEAINATQTGTGDIVIEIQGDVAGNQPVERPNEYTYLETGGAVRIDTIGDASIVVKSGGSLDGGTGLAVQDVSTNADTTTSLVVDGTLNGGIEMGAGQDSVVIGATATLADGIVLDGGADADSIVFSNDVILMAENLMNWETVGFEGPSNSSLSGELNAEELTLGTGSQLSILDGLTLSGDMTNAGARVSLQDDDASDTLQIDGDLDGTGSLAFDVNFETGETDQVQIGGDVTGAYTVDVNPLGASANANNITLITVSGTAAEDAFTLEDGPISFAGFDYDLVQTAPLTWGLQTEVNVSGVNFTALSAVLAHGFSETSGFSARTGSRNLAGGTVRTKSAFGEGGEYTPRLSWVTISESQQTEAITGGSYESRASQISAGRELTRIPVQGGLWVIDATARYFDVAATSETTDDSGSISGDGLSFDLAAAWIGTNDVYIDLQGQLGFSRHDMSDSLGVSVTDVKSSFTGLRAEVGKRFDLSETRSFTLHSDVSILNVDTDTFELNVDDLSATPGTNQQLTVGIGGAYQWQAGNTTLRVAADFERQLNDGTTLEVGPNTFTYDNSGTFGAIEIGAVTSLSDNINATFAGRYLSDIGNDLDSERVTLSIGLNAVW